LPPGHKKRRKCSSFHKNRRHWLTDNEVNRFQNIVERAFRLEIEAENFVVG
jgi:hypothetical protein